MTTVTIAANIAKLSKFFQRLDGKNFFVGHGASRKIIAPAQSMHTSGKPVNM